MRRIFASDTWTTRISPQQCCLAVRETILPLVLTHLRQLHTCSLEHPDKRRMWTNWSKSSRGHHWSGGWNTRYEKSLTEMDVISLQRRRLWGILRGVRQYNEKQRLKAGTQDIQIRYEECFFFTIGFVEDWRGCRCSLEIFKTQLDKALQPDLMWLCLQQRGLPEVPPNLNCSMFLWHCSVYLNYSLCFQRQVTVSETDPAVDYMLQAAALGEELQPF